MSGKLVLYRDPGFTRTHYHSGMLLTAEMFRQEQEYFSKRLDQITRLLAGSNRRMGLEIAFRDGEVRLSSGFYVTGEGRILELKEDVTFGRDWDDGVYGIYIGIIFAETDPVPVPVGGTDADREVFSGIREEQCVWTWKAESRKKSDNEKEGILLYRIGKRGDVFRINP